MGEIGDEFILASHRIQPQSLLEAGYRFRFPGIDEALRHELQAQACSIWVLLVTMVFRNVLTNFSVSCKISQ